VKISAAGLKLIKEFEGLRLTTYTCAAGVLTIGYGSTGPHATPGKTITEAEAEALLLKDLVRFETGVSELITKPLTQGQFDALVSFCFNLGCGALEESTLRRRLNAGEDPNTVFPQELPKWVKAGGQTLPGLVRRREAEVKLATSGGGATAAAGTTVTIKAMQATLLKKRPVAGTELADNEKSAVEVGKEYAKAQVLDTEAGHTLLDLPYGAGQFWLFDDHWQGLSATPAQPTGGEVKLPGFIHWDQKNNQSDGWRECQSSSIAMCLKFLGIGNLSDDQQYVSIVEKYGDTTERQPHFDAMKQLGYTKATWHTNLNAEAIKAEINKGKPVAVGALHKGHVSNPSGGGHFVVIYGYGPDYWCVQDPYGEQDLVNGDFCNAAIGAGKDQKYSFKNFNPRLFVANPSDGWGWTFA
jgi:lysozyme